MQGSLNLPPVIIRSSRKTAALMLSICAGFVAIGLMMARDPEENPVIAYFVSGFFALGIPLFGWRLIRPDTLTLTPDGVFWQSIFRSVRWKWEEVQDFRAYSPTGKPGSKHVGFDFTDTYREGTSTFSRVSKQVTGVYGSFGDGWELSAADLADLLNNARIRWLRPRK